MKNTFVLLILLSTGKLVFAQTDVIKSDNYSLSKIHISFTSKNSLGLAKKSRFSLLDNGQSGDYQYFMDLVKNKQAELDITAKKSLLGKPILHPITNSENNWLTRNSFQRYSEWNPPLISLLDLVATFASIGIPRSTHSNYTSAFNDYLKSIPKQDHQ